VRHNSNLKKDILTIDVLNDQQLQFRVLLSHQLIALKSLHVHVDVLRFAIVILPNPLDEGVYLNVYLNVYLEPQLGKGIYRRHANAILEEMLLDSPLIPMPAMSFIL
jgi:hypothetical protein